jgi:hypothetical protein
MKRELKLITSGDLKKLRKIFGPLRSQLEIFLILPKIFFVKFLRKNEKILKFWIFKI